MWYALGLAFIFLIILFVSLQIAFTIVLPRKRSLGDTEKLEKSKDSTLFDFYDKYLSKTKYIKSRFGYQLKLYYFLKEESKKFVVIAHGHTYTHHGCIKYARMMFDEGYSVILFDQRYHGDSGGKNSTLGHYEKFDLYDIITDVFNEFGSDIYLGTYGESMGSATVLLEQELDLRVKFVISDCGFSDLRRLITEKIKKNHLPKFFIFFVDIFVKIITGVHLKEVSPIAAVKNAKIPILLIHGLEDKFIGFQHSVDMYDNNNDKSTIMLAENNSTHANSYFADKEKYEQIVKRFLEENTNDKI
jgi:dipeptidyl aminopeptidase/acylaminoacyl peptidase